MTADLRLIRIYLTGTTIITKKGAVKKHSNFKGGLIKEKLNKQAWQKHENKAFAKLVCFLRDKWGFVEVFD